MMTALLVALCGCESMADAMGSVKERITSRDPGRSQTFGAEPRRTYAAARAAATHMGYRFVRGGAAQGEFEALTGVAPGDRHGTARQLGMKVTLEPTLDGTGTIVTVRLTEIVEADSSNRAGQGTEAPLRDTPQYQVFFRQLDAALKQ